MFMFQLFFISDSRLEAFKCSRPDTPPPGQRSSPRLLFILLDNEVSGVVKEIIKGHDNNQSCGLLPEGNTKLQRVK